MTARKIYLALLALLGIGAIFGGFVLMISRTGRIVWHAVIPAAKLSLREFFAAGNPFIRRAWFNARLDRVVVNKETRK